MNKLLLFTTVLFVSLYSYGVKRDYATHQSVDESTITSIVEYADYLSFNVESAVQVIKNNASHDDEIKTVLLNHDLKQELIEALAHHYTVSKVYVTQLFDFPLNELPDDLKGTVLEQLIQNTITLQEAVASVKALATVNKKWTTVLANINFTMHIIQLLSKKYSVSLWDAALALKTKTAARALGVHAHLLSNDDIQAIQDYVINSNNKTLEFALETGINFGPVVLGNFLSIFLEKHLTNNNEYNQLIVDKLIKAGADLNVNTSPLLVKTLDQFQFTQKKYTTPLMAALSSKSLMLIEKLLQAGANANGVSVDRYSQCDNYPLMTAINNCNPETVKLLLQAGAHANKQGYTWERDMVTTPINAVIEHSSQEDKFKLVKLLLSYNANPNKLDNYSESALSQALRFTTAQEGIVKFLIDNYPVIDFVNADGLTLSEQAILFYDKEQYALLYHHLNSQVELEFLKTLNVLFNVINGWDTQWNDEGTEFEQTKELMQFLLGYRPNPFKKCDINRQPDVNGNSILDALKPLPTDSDDTVNRKQLIKKMLVEFVNKATQEKKLALLKVLQGTAVASSTETNITNLPPEILNAIASYTLPRYLPKEDQPLLHK